MKLAVIKIDRVLIFGLKGYLPFQSSGFAYPVVSTSDYLTKPLDCQTYFDSSGIFDDEAEFESNEGEYVRLHFENKIDYNWALNNLDEFTEELTKRLNRLAKELGKGLRYQEEKQREFSNV
jgi:hypothetical protein